MRFSIQKDLLKSALDVAVLAVDKKEQDARSTFLFDVRDENELFIWSTNHKMMTKVPTTLVPESLKGSGKFTVEASRLSKWVKNVFEDVVTVEVEDLSVTMTCGDAKGHFASKDPATFPDFQNRLNDGKVLFSGNPETFINALQLVQPFIGDGTSNNDVANNMQVSELRGREMLATDGKCVSLYLVAPPEEGESDSLDQYTELLSGFDTDEERQKHTFKVGSDEIRGLIKFLDKTCTQSFTVSKNDLYLVESDDGSAFGYTGSIYNLPNISGIPKDLEEPEIWRLDKARLSDAVRALEATADDDDLALSMHVSGSEGVEGVLTLSMKDALERNDSTIKMPVFREKVSRDEVSFVINRKFLTNPLSLYDGNEVRLGVSAPEGPGTKYVKYHEVTDSGDTRICIITLRMR